MGPLNATVPFELVGTESVASSTLAVLVRVNAVPGLLLGMSRPVQAVGPRASPVATIGTRVGSGTPAESTKVGSAPYECENTQRSVYLALSNDPRSGRGQQPRDTPTHRS
jgi:hypothetical protein